jgi:hypothetical protein
MLPGSAHGRGWELEVGAPELEKTEEVCRDANNKGMEDVGDGGGGGKKRALVVTTEWVKEMLNAFSDDPSIRAAAKTEEIRNFVAKLAPGEVYYIAESRHGVLGWSAYCRLALKVSHDRCIVYTDKQGELNNTQFCNRTQHHRVQMGELERMRAQWKRRQVVGHAMKDIEVYPRNNHFVKRPNPQSIWISFKDDDIHVNDDLAIKPVFNAAQSVGGVVPQPSAGYCPLSPLSLEVDKILSSMDQADAPTNCPNIDVGERDALLRKCSSLVEAFLPPDADPAFAESAPDATHDSLVSVGSPTAASPAIQLAEPTCPTHTQPTLRESFEAGPGSSASKAAAIVLVAGGLAAHVAAETDPCGQPSLSLPPTIRPRIPSECRTMEDCFAMADYILQVLVAQNDNDEDVVHRLADYLETEDYSTSFSGYDTIGISKELLRVSLSKWLKRVIRRPRHRFAIDWEPSARLELQMHPARPEHCHDNVADFFQDHLEELLEELNASGDGLRALSIIGPMLKKHPECVMRLTPRSRNGMCVWCHEKQLICKCVLRAAKRHVAGHPCQDFSDQGLHLGFAGPTTIHLLAFIGLRLIIQEHEINTENCMNFPISFMCEYLPMYEQTSSILNPVHYGWPITRERMWQSFRRKLKTLAFRYPLDPFARMFRRHCRLSWRAFLTERDPAVMQAELDWASSRPTSRWTGGSKSATLPMASDGAEVIDFSSYPDGTPSIFEQVLTTMEHKHLTLYRRKCSAELSYQLQQNPVSHGQNSTHAIANTVIRNDGMRWSNPDRRWVLSTEVPLLQGIPTTTRWSSGEVVSSFQVPDSRRTRGHTIELVGNGMHTSVALVMDVFQFQSVDRIDKGSLYRTQHLAPKRGGDIVEIESDDSEEEGEGTQTQRPPAKKRLCSKQADFSIVLH